MANTTHWFRFTLQEIAMSTFRPLCYIAGSLVIFGLMAGPLQAQSSAPEKKSSHKAEKVKQGKGKKKEAPKVSQKINMEVLKDGYH